MNLSSTKFRLTMMKRIFTLLFAATAAQSSATAQEVNSYWIEYGNEPVLIQQNNNGATQTLKFVSFQDWMLVAELEGGVG